jgi:hypothetical protein
MPAGLTRSIVLANPSFTTLRANLLAAVKYLFLKYHMINIYMKKRKEKKKESNVICESNNKAKTKPFTHLTHQNL